MPELEGNREHLQRNSLLWNLGGGLVVGLYGASVWDWGSSKFHLREEDWLGEDTKHGGADKFGHAWTAYTLTALTADLHESWGATREEAALQGALSAILFTSLIELGDGTSPDHGYSWEDQAFNLAGAGLEYLRLRSPWLAQRLQFRWEWGPSRAFRDREVEDMSTDYSGARYILAMPLRGWGLEQRPWRWLELQVGYASRGYSVSYMHYDKERIGYLGVGLNLTGILEDTTGHDAWRVFDYYQVPGLHKSLETNF